jgi:hypothetical protein
VVFATSRFQTARLITVDGGALEDVVVSNLPMRDITNAPLFIRLGNRAHGPGQPPVGARRRVRISNIIAYNSDPRYGCIISSNPGGCIEDMALSNIHLVFRGGVTREDAAIIVGEHESEYPEPHTFGTMPAYGFFVRHVRGFSMQQVKLESLATDMRPPLMVHDATDVQLIHVQVAHAATIPILVVRDVYGLTLERCRGLPELREHEQIEEARFGITTPALTR